MHIYSEFHLPLHCLLSGMNNFFIYLWIAVVFTTLNCLVSSTNVVILLFTLNKHAEEHKLEHSSAELLSETYQPLFRVFTPIIHVWSFDLSQDALVFFKNLYKRASLNGFWTSRKTCGMTEL